MGRGELVSIASWKSGQKGVSWSRARKGNKERKEGLVLVNGMSLVFWLGGLTRQFPKTLEAMLNARQHSHSCTLITLELSTHILPEVISFGHRSFVEQSHWKCICSSYVSKESAYLIWTSWDLASQQTCRPLLCLKITSRSNGWVRGETSRKEGRCIERKDKNEMWKKGMRWSQWSVRMELKSPDRRSECCSGQNVCFLWCVWGLIQQTKETIDK